MLKVFDTKCEDCGQVIEQYVEDGNQFKRCPVCNGLMVRLFTTMNYKLVYNNKTDVCGWACHNYESSQYWSMVKEAEERTGKRHKAINED